MLCTITIRLHISLNLAGYFYVLNSSPIFLKIKSNYSSYMLVFTSRMENSVDPDQLASQKPADLDLHCFQDRIFSSLA